MQEDLDEKTCLSDEFLFWALPVTNLGKDIVWILVFLAGNGLKIYEYRKRQEVKATKTNAIYSSAEDPLSHRLSM